MSEPISRDGLLHQVRNLPPRARSTLLVAIDGCGGSGKSTLAEWLASEVGAEVVHIDDFGRPGRPYEAWDWQRFRGQVLQPLLQDRPARYQRYDWDSDRLAEWIDVEPGGILIVEGVSTTRTELGDPWDLKVWVECPYDLRLARGMERDGENMREVWVDRWMPEEDEYVQAQAPHERADYIILGY